MELTATIRSVRYRFPNLRSVLAKANEVKSGDQLAGIAAGTETERVAAKMVLADVPLGEIIDGPVIDPDIDDVSRQILAAHDSKAIRPWRSKTVGEFREWLLSDDANGRAIATVQAGVLPEVAAAVAKIMSNKDLIFAASKIRNVTRCRNTLGAEGVLAVRVQPNHPTDDLAGILWAALDGLLFGCGDAVIGVNPATDSIGVVEKILRGLDRLIETIAAPTQACCLAHITTQLQCLDRGAPIDLLFQSVAGTQRANESFGVTLAMLKEGRDAVLQKRHSRAVDWTGSQVMYFETGQGSALSAEAHHGVDQLTLEARAQAVARVYDPFLVNSVVGFIGPEYLYDERQIIRAGLEDHFVGKLMGLPIGCDVCHTNHAEADHNSLDNGLLLLTAAGCNYFMGVPAGDDVMLNYQTTSYHDLAMARRLFGLKPAPEFCTWLEDRGLFENGQLLAANDIARDRLLADSARLLQ